MLVFIDRVYSSPVREIVEAGRLSWPFHMKVHYTDINNLTMPDEDNVLVVFERQAEDDNKNYLHNLASGKLSVYLSQLRELGVVYAIVDISAKPQATHGLSMRIMMAADTAVVPTKDRMVWETVR